MNLKGVFSDKSESTKLLLFMLIVFISSFIGVVLIGIISLAELNFLQENIIQLRITQFISSVSIFIIPSLLFSYFVNDLYIQSLRFNSKFKRQSILIILMIILFSQPLVSYCMQLNSDLINSISDYIPNIVEFFIKWEDSAKKITESFLEMNHFGDLLINLFLIAFIPAIGEEMFFRGIIQTKLKNILKNPHIAILIASFIFSAVHMQFFGFLARFILGAILGYLFYYSGSLWTSVMGHFINNGLAILLMYFPFSEKINTDIENIDISILQASIFLMIVLFFLWIYKQINNKAID
tara:strand:- start:814 stop:1698 length:885 start_codon:yes stop_codon:yes gene_type:complete